MYTLQPCFMARDLWRLRKLIRCVGENAVNYIIPDKSLGLEILALKMTSKI